MFERFTESAIKTIMNAHDEARRLGHNFVGTEQILLGLVGEGGVAGTTLKSFGLKLKNTRKEVEKIIGYGSGFVAVDIPFTPRAKSVLEQSIKIADELGHQCIEPEHLLLGLLKENDGVSIKIINAMGIDVMTLHQAVSDEMATTKYLKIKTVPDSDKET